MCRAAQAANSLTCEMCFSGWFRLSTKKKTVLTGCVVVSGVNVNSHVENVTGSASRVGRDGH